MRLVGFLANSEDVSHTFVAHAVAASSTGRDPACERSHRVNVVAPPGSALAGESLGGKPGSWAAKILLLPVRQCAGTGTTLGITWPVGAIAFHFRRHFVPLMISPYQIGT